MDPTAQFICYLIAFVAFAASAVIAFAQRTGAAGALVPAGLAAAVFVFMWNAAEAI